MPFPWYSLRRMSNIKCPQCGHVFDVPQAQPSKRKSMWEPFTERARRSVVLAQEEAQNLECDYLGPEHLLLGIMAESESPGARAILSFGVPIETLRSEIASIIGRGDRRKESEFVFNTDAKQAIEYAFEEARQLDHPYLATGHLLLGILRVGDKVTSKALESVGIEKEKLRTEILNKAAQGFS
jgi:ATP-dependent Clp protease ATP-binding subunit ClpC